MTSVATLGSHCALQVLKGAKDEGFKTILVCEKKREKLYRRFSFIDEFVKPGKYIYTLVMLDRQNKTKLVYLEVNEVAKEVLHIIPTYGQENWKKERQEKI